MSQYTTAANRINHKGTPTETSIFYSLAIQALSVPHTSEILREVDALVAWPGIVLDAAPRHAVLDWNNGIGKRHLLVAGYHEQDVAEEKFSLSKMEETLGLRRQHGVHTQIHAGHAGQQATWVAEKVKELGITSVALYIPSFHFLRGLLTTVESFRRLGIRIPIIPKTTPISPFERSLLDAKSLVRDLCEMDVIHAEADPRMKSYQLKKESGSPGDVATVEVWEDYLRWLYDQPLLTSQLMKANQD